MSRQGLLGLLVNRRRAAGGMTRHDSRIRTSGGENSRTAHERGRSGGVGWTARGRARRRVFGVELCDAARYRSAKPRQGVRGKWRADFCGPEKLFVPARHDASLSRRPDEAGIRVSESAGDAQLRVRKFVYRVISCLQCSLAPVKSIWFPDDFSGAAPANCVDALLKEKTMPLSQPQTKRAEG